MDVYRWGGGGGTAQRRCEARDGCVWTGGGGGGVQHRNTEAKGGEVDVYRLAERRGGGGGGGGGGGQHRDGERRKMEREVSTY